MFRYSKQFESDSRYRDAEVVLLLERRQKELPTEKGQRTLNEAAERYLRKHNENWIDFVPATARELSL
jgi:hypothetical protein